MPVYVYRVIPKRTSHKPEDIFEISQSIHDAPLAYHPKTGQPIERIICVPTIGKGAVGDSELRQAGLTKYKKTSDGTYEKQS